MSTVSNINDLNENVFNEIFDFLSLKNRINCELVCIRWRSILKRRLQKVVKFCFENESNQSKSICSNRTHNSTSNDVFYFDEDNGLDSYKIDRLMNKFSIQSIHLQSKDIKQLKRLKVLSTLSKYADNLEHLQIELFEGPFTRNDLQLLFLNWSKNLKHLIIKFQHDNGKILNRKTIMKFFEICIELELFYFKSPFLREQSLDYIPTKLNSLFLFDTELDFESFSLLIQGNGSIFRQLKLGACLKSEHLNCITSNLLNLNLLSLDCIQLDEQLNDFSFLNNIQKLEKLEVLRFWLDDGQQVNNLDKEFKSIIKRCNLMRKVHIENALLTDQSLTFVSIYWKNLQSFKLYSSFNQHSKITDKSLIEFLRLESIHTLSIPNSLLSVSLLEKLIDRPKFSYLILRENCSFVYNLFDKFKMKATKANYNQYKLKLKEDNFFSLFNFKRPDNFQLKSAKVFNFDL